MTATHAAPPLVTHSPAEAVEALRAAGLRASSARRLLLDALFAADGPVSADEIAAGLDGRVRPTDAASVYRNLETLEGLGLVRHVHLGHGPSLYALAGSLAPSYLVCDSCGERRPAGDEELRPVRDAVREQFGYETSFSHFPIVGLCATCRERP